jgi:carboxypeptidase Taq
MDIEVIHMNIQSKLQELKNRLEEIDEIETSIGVLYWDERTQMPGKGAKKRGQQIATLTRISHEKSVNPELGKLIERLIPYAESLSYDSDDAALIRVARIDYERATKLPAAFVAEVEEHGSASFHAWAKARSENDFDSVQP